MANSEAVAHTPQPHIGEAYVGIKYSISTMYRGAVPITERPLTYDLEPRRGTGWRGHSDPTKALHSGRFACPELRAIVGLEVCETAPRFTLCSFLLARRPHTGSCGFFSGRAIRVCRSKPRHYKCLIASWFSCAPAESTVLL